jgi:hypothetical protein
VRACAAHGKRRAAMQLLTSLLAFSDALALAATYDERLAIVEEARLLSLSVLRCFCVLSV